MVSFAIIVIIIRMYGVLGHKPNSNAFLELSAIDALIAIIM